MDHKGDMAVHICGELAESGNELILSDKTIIGVAIYTHHELQVVNDDMCDVVHVHGVWHGL